MPLFKKPKSGAEQAPPAKAVQPPAPVAEVKEEVPVAEEPKPTEDQGKEEAKDGAVQPAAEKKDEKQAGGEPDDNLMQIFMEDQEGLGSSTTQYEAFLASLTMEEIAADATALLTEVKKRLGA